MAVSTTPKCFKARCAQTRPPQKSACLDADTVLTRCLAFFRTLMPVDGITMTVYDPQTRSVVHVAAAGQSGFKPSDTPIPLPDEAVRFVEEDRGKPVEIINHPEEHIAARWVCEALGRQNVSFMILKLEIEAQRLGVISVLAEGESRYTREHARRLELLHDPFAISLANTLKHQEVLRLKDLLLEDNQYLKRQLHRMSGDEIVGSEFSDSMSSPSPSRPCARENQISRHLSTISWLKRHEK